MDLLRFKVSGRTRFLSLDLSGKYFLLVETVDWVPNRYFTPKLDSGSIGNIGCIASFYRTKYRIIWKEGLRPSISRAFQAFPLMMKVKIAYYAILYYGSDFYKAPTKSNTINYVINL